MQAAVTLNDIYIPQLENMSRVQIVYGGAASGKSVFKAQQIPLDLLAGGRNYLVCRAVARTIRRSVFNEIRKAIGDAGLSQYFDVNKSEGIITCIPTGMQVLFAGLDDVEKVKSITPEKGALTDVWIEEGTEAQKDDIRQLLLRQRGGDEATPKRLHMTFNPIYQMHWIYEEYFAPIGWQTDQTEYTSPELSILKTWYVHNRFLTAQDVERLEGEQDEYYRGVYTFGNWGVLGDVIFANWRIEDLSGVRNQFDNLRHGLDFGFASHPAGISVSHYDPARKTIYIFGELYETGLTNDLLSEEALRLCGKARIIGDSAEPKSIAEMQQRGVSITGARKGKDSITHGIDWLKQHLIIVDKTCVNHIKELQQYQWKKDASGNAVSPPKPIDRNNHLIDALRYAYEDDSAGGWWMS